MSEKPKEGRGREGAVAIVLAVAFALLLLYVLSVGPVYVLRRHELIGDDFLFVLYYPIHELCALSPGFNTAIKWYVALWIGTAPLKRI